MYLLILTRFWKKEESIQGRQLFKNEQVKISISIFFSLGTGFHRLECYKKYN